MVLDPTATVTGTGGLLAAIWLILKYKPWLSNGPRNGHKKSGDLDPAEWDARIKRIVEEVVDAKFEMVTMRRDEQMARMVQDAVLHIFSERTDQLRKLFRDEMRSFYGLTGSRRWDKD